MKGCGEDRGFVQGGITVFLTLLFGIILALISVSVENVRYLTGNAYVHTAAEGAALAVFGEYNRELYEEYGLFAYGGYGRKNGQELAQNVMEQLECALDVSDTNAAKRSVDIYRITEVLCAVKDVQSLTEPDVFHRQIREYLAVNAIEDLSRKLKNQYEKESRDEEKSLKETLDMTGAYERGEQNTTQVQDKDENSQMDHAGGNPLETFRELLRDGILSLVCDVETLADGQSGKETSASTADLLMEILFRGDSSMSSPLQESARRAELICYGNAMFSSYVTDRNRSVRYGLEYLATGKEEERDSLLSVVNQLLLLRTMANYAYVNTDEELIGESLATATVIAGLLEMPPLINAIQQTILLILSVEESFVDITALLQGRSVPLIKTKTTFQMKYQEICAAGKKLFAGKAKNFNKSQGKFIKGYFDYTQYLWIFLMGISEELLRERTCSLIEVDLRERFNQTFTIEQCIYGAKFSLSYSQALLWAAFYGGDVAKERSVETWHSYG
ncbi:MAG: hypothetical protein J1E62_08620 [Lachnospiraceae bacterium]|nr:hypothetical protein [Lachnospiraceae bacterium]